MAPVRQARRCTGHRSRDRQPCEAWAVNGATVCVTHGGRSPQVVMAAAERQLERRMRQTLARLEVDPVSDPLTELSRLAGQVGKTGSRSV